MGARRLSVLPDRKRVGMNAEHASRTTKFVVDGAKVYLFDAKLSKKRGAHDAGLDSDVENAFSNDFATDDFVGMKFLAIRI
jgi:hypothetical protein